MTYSMNYKNFYGNWKFKIFKANSRDDALAIAKDIYESQTRELCCGFYLMDFYGNIINF